VKLRASGQANLHRENSRLLIRTRINEALQRINTVNALWSPEVKKLMIHSAPTTRDNSGKCARRKWETSSPAQDHPRSASTLGTLLQELRLSGTRLDFSRNQTIFSEGDRAGFVYKIISGVTRICRHTSNGDRHITDFVLPGEMIAFAEYSEHTFTAETVTPATVTSYKRANFDRLVETNLEVRTQLHSLLTASLLSSHHQLLVLGCQSAKERLASFLIRLANRTLVGAGQRLELAMGRHDIADHLGLTIETVCRAIAALKDERLIVVPNSHQLILSNLAALRVLAIAA
jgi:CRP-like cAMP-binding protein